MRILVLCKRHYTGKDLIEDRYGRLFELPAWLVRLGHQVAGVALSYRRASTGEYRWDDRPDLIWYSENIGTVPFLSYARTLRRIIRETRPDLIWACSDAFHAILGWQLQQSLGIPAILDLYDNFESFPATRLPGMLSMFRRACRSAAGLTLVGDALRVYVREQYGVDPPMLVLHNGTDPTLFYPRDKLASRRALGLPELGKLIGTAGAITTGRGIATMFEAFLALADEMPDLYLVFAGPRDATPSRYHHPRIIDLGILPLERVPLLLTALDLGVISNIDSAFGRYCFPQKLYELAACGTAFVAADIGETSVMLHQHPHLLFPPGDAIGLTSGIRDRLTLDNSQGSPLHPRTWEDLARELDGFFRSLLSPG